MTDETIGYMCRVDYEHELGFAKGGNAVYPSEEDLREFRACADSCGIVKVAVRLVEVVVEGTDND